MIDDVVALYVDPRGPYPKLLAEWFDAERNGMLYRGWKPVVAHPPCGPWSHLSKLHKRADEIAIAPHAVALVQRLGGVLEHPRDSRLFAACGLPRPGTNDLIVDVQQCFGGHPARKKTRLYIVGLRGPLPSFPPAREPTHWASGSRTAPRGPVPQGIKVCSAQQRTRTPIDFAKWLIAVAQRCGPPIDAP